MHKHQEATKHERKQRQLASEETLREKAAERALIRVRAEKAEKNRILLVARNPVITCEVAEMVMDDEFHGHEEPVKVRIPFAALPMQCQRAAVVEYMKLH